MSVSQNQKPRTEPTLHAKPLLQRMTFDNVRETPYVAPEQPPVRYLPWLLLIFLIVLVLAIYQESRNHFYQSAFWHWYSNKLTYQLKDGATTQIHYPAAGPFDQRFGYSRLPVWIEKLQQSGFRLTAQSEFSPALQQYAGLGFYPPYTEKNSAGLLVNSCQQQTLYSHQAPAMQFDDLTKVAPLIIQSLLFVEDRTLLTPDHPRANPVLNLPRLGAAVWSQLQRAAGIPAAAAGGAIAAAGATAAAAAPAAGAR